MSDRARETVLFSQSQIAARVADIAGEIAARATKPDIAVPILQGAFVFAADLLRALAGRGLDLPTEFLWLRAYGNRERAGDVRVLVAPSDIVRGRNVLLIDGVLESGVTAARARELLLEAGAMSVVFAVAVRKPHPQAAITADHVCFEAGPEFLYGYGMDRAGLARGLPNIRIAVTD